MLGCCRGTLPWDGGGGFGGKGASSAKFGRNLPCGECGSWVTKSKRNLIQIYHDKKRFAATKSAEESNKILTKAYKAQAGTERTDRRARRGAQQV